MREKMEDAGDWRHVINFFVWKLMRIGELSSVETRAVLLNFISVFLCALSF